MYAAKMRGKNKNRLRAHENAQPEEKGDGYQIDDGAGDNSHEQTGAAASTLVANSLLVGNPTRTSIIVA
jgi:hypothetical protein